MPSKSTFKIAVATVALALASVGAQATVVNSADVAGLRTFTDSSTGRVWLDMDNFFDVTATSGTTGNAMIATAQAAGFTFATTADVHQLLDSLPLTGGEWAGYAAVMGYGHPRELIWGMLDDGNGNPYGWAWSFSGDVGWNFAADITDASIVQNSDFPGAVDLGIWAYQTSNPVPEPETYALMLAGLGVLGFVAKRRKA